MEEKVYFQNSKGNKLCGILSNSTGDLSKLIMIIVPGFGSNKNKPNYLVMVDELNKLLVSSFRFDVYGHGESEGNFEDITISEVVDDILQAIAFLKKKGHSRIGLIGSSFGGISSIMAASKIKDLVCLALKSPVSNYIDRTKYILTEEKILDWKTKGYRIDEDGNSVNYTFFEDFDKNNGYKAAKFINIPTVIVHGDADESVPYAQSVKLVSLLQNGVLITVHGANHRYTNPEHAKQMIQAISNFVKRYV